MTRSLLATCAALLALSCTGTPPSASDDEAFASSSAGVTVPGPWRPAPAVLAVGDRQRVTHDGLPLTNGACTDPNPWACSCGSHPECSRGLPGALELASYLRRRFPQISSIGGVGSCCRQATGSPAYLSAHSLGRAIDVMIPRIGADADNTLGDPIATWAIENAQSVGIQYVAWDRAQWRASKPPGQRWSTLSSSSLPHTDHLHIELNKAGARKQTPFFTGGASTGGGETCTAACRGSVVVQADCSTGDCASYGATCLADPAPRCVYAQCPPTGTGRVCLDETRVADCANGLPTSIGNCGAYGSFCSSAGVATTAARCVFSLCVSGPTEVPTNVTRCSLTPGRQLECHADTTFRELPCPAGQVCSMVGGVAHCEAARPECPVPAPGAPLDDRTVCLSTGEWARCINGNVFSVEPCGEDETCSDLGGQPHCANEACLTAPGGSACGSDYTRLACDALGTVEQETGCPDGSRCVDHGGTAACEASCGDGTCGPGETCAGCPADCACAACGDGTCAAGETCQGCPGDCGRCDGCGDGACGAREDCSTCPADCGSCAGCGDGTCGGGESCASCPSDCGACGFCGDGACSGDESCADCRADCGGCAGSCGDGACGPDESCESCRADCGRCPAADAGPDPLPAPAPQGCGCGPGASASAWLAAALVRRRRRAANGA